MAEIELAPLTDRLGEEEVAELAAALEEVGARPLPRQDDAGASTVGKGVDEEVMSEFMDRLEAYDIAADIYLPIEFEGRIEVGDLRVGSAQTLLDVLEEMKDDLDMEQEDVDAAEDEYEDIPRLQSELRHVWKMMSLGAQNALERRLSLHVVM